jgi:ATP-binding cassette, subfamily B, heavy metal transporter
MRESATHAENALGQAPNRCNGGAMLAFIRLLLDRRLARLVSGAAALIAAGSLAAALAPTLLKGLIDALAQAHGEISIEAPTMWAALYVAALLLARVLGEYRLLAVGRVEQMLCTRARQRLFDHLIRLPLGSYLSQPLGAMQASVEQGIRGLGILVTRSLASIAPVLLELAVVAVVLAQLEQAKFLLILVAAAALFVLVMKHPAAQLHEAARAISASQLRAAATVTEGLAHIEVIKSFAAERRVSQRYQCDIAGIELSWDQFFRLRKLSGLATSIVFALCLGATLGVAVREYVRGSMSLGEVVLVHAYALRLLVPLESIAMAVRELIQASALLDPMLARLGERRERPGQIILGKDEPAPCAIEFDAVSLRHDGRAAALRRVSFRAPVGSTLALVGPSGAGKSSVVKLVLKLHAPSAGVIRIMGQPLDALDPMSVRAAIALVPQDCALLNDSIANNIALGRPGASMGEIEEAAKQACAHEFIERLPGGYECQVGERGLKLSGGERQRIAIARALLKRSKILILDEATSALDVATEARVLGNLIGNARGRTVLMVSHRPSAASLADQILLFEEGAIVECGSHTELLRRPGAYAALWARQH